MSHNRTKKDDVEYFFKSFIHSVINDLTEHGRTYVYDKHVQSGKSHFYKLLDKRLMK